MFKLICELFIDIEPACVFAHFCVYVCVCQVKLNKQISYKQAADEKIRREKERGAKRAYKTRTSGKIKFSVPDK